MKFGYTAKSGTGAITTGVLDAESLADAQMRLREMGLFALSLNKSTRSPSTGSWNVGRGRVTNRDLLALTSQLAIMTKAGVDLAGALKSVAEHTVKPSLKRTIVAVHRDVESGASVSQALQRHVHIFGEAYVASVAAGETAGRLPDVLHRLSGMLRSEMRLRNRVRTLMAYPLVLSTVSFSVLCGLVFFVLPTFAGIFGDYEIPLPVLTQILIDVSSEMRARFFIYIPLAIMAIVALIVFKRSAVGRRLWDAVLLNTVVIREASRTLLAGRAFLLLGIMLESGVPLLESLRMTRAAMRNIYFREMFDVLENDILNGRGMGDTLARTSFLPPAAAQMIRTGEKTGSLAMVTQTLGEYYEEEGEVKLRELATILEPAIIIVMGLVVATIVLSVMLPMFDFATLANQ
jgi:type II secretory pathway component PulF